MLSSVNTLDNEPAQALKSSPVQKTQANSRSLWFTQNRRENIHRNPTQTWDWHDLWLLIILYASLVTDETGNHNVIIIIIIYAQVQNLLFFIHIRNFKSCHDCIGGRDSPISVLWSWCCSSELWKPLFLRPVYPLGSLLWVMQIEQVIQENRQKHRASV